MTRAATPVLDRIIDKLEVGDCWLWTGAVNRGGYGVARNDDGVARIAHRLVWELLVGPVEDELDLDHLCRVRRCCNPDHLEPVTRQVNVDRGLYAAGRQRKTTCRYGHKLSIKPRVCRECAKRRNREYRLRLKESA